MTVVAVLVGALVGTALRLGTDAVVASPWSTLVVNVVGSLALGLLVARVWPTAPGWLRAGLGPGLLGSFTTFSALAVAVVTLADAGESLAALGSLALALVAGFGAALLGLRLGARRGDPVPSPSEADA